jgi:hypothetical protein
VRKAVHAEEAEVSLLPGAAPHHVEGVGSGGSLGARARGTRDERGGAKEKDGGGSGCFHDENLRRRVSAA